MSNAVSKFVSRLFHARTNAHILHLGVKGPGSYAAHKALNEFYDEIVELTDSFAEAYQGVYGLITDWPEDYRLPNKDPLTELRLVSSEIKGTRDDLPEDSELQNLIDEIQSLVDSTIYKLRFLE